MMFPKTLYLVALAFFAALPPVFSQQEAAQDTLKPGWYFSVAKLPVGPLLGPTVGTPSFAGSDTMYLSTREHPDPNTGGVVEYVRSRSEWQGRLLFREDVGVAVFRRDSLYFATINGNKNTGKVRSLRTQSERILWSETTENSFILDDRSGEIWLSKMFQLIAVTCEEQKIELPGFPREIYRNNSTTLAATFQHMIIKQNGGQRLYTTSEVGGNFYGLGHFRGKPVVAAGGLRYYDATSGAWQWFYVEGTEPATSLVTRLFTNEFGLVLYCDTPLGDPRQGIWYARGQKLQRIASGPVALDGLVDSTIVYREAPGGDWDHPLMWAATLTDTSLTTAVKDRLTDAAPQSLSLTQNYPNPFNPSTTIRFSLPKRTHVTLRIYNALGQEVQTLVDGPLAAGEHEVSWNASGHPSGAYFVRFAADGQIRTIKILLVR